MGRVFTAQGYQYPVTTDHVSPDNRMAQSNTVVLRMYIELFCCGPFLLDGQLWPSLIEHGAWIFAFKTNMTGKPLFYTTYVAYLIGVNFALSILGCTIFDKGDRHGYAGDTRSGQRVWH